MGLGIHAVSLVAQMVKNLAAMLETEVWSLGWLDTMEKGMATHSRIVAWRVPWTEEPCEVVHRVTQSLRGLKWASRPTVETWKGDETFFSRALPLCRHHPPPPPCPDLGKRELNSADTLISAQWDPFWTPWPPELKDNTFVLL